MNQFQDKLRAGDADGALVVARAMVGSLIHDAGVVADLAEKARYAQLIAGRLRLPVVESHRIVLAAWLSALEKTPEVFDVLRRQHQLESILGPVDPNDGQDTSSAGREILDLVSTFQSLRRENPLAERIDVMRRELKRVWATTPRRQTLLAKFLLVLDDESFLKNLEVPAARIMVVDPAEVVSSVLTLPLQSKGYQVRVIGNVEDCLAALANDVPDVLIAEMDMPIQDGLTLCRKIKADAVLVKIPVLMLTSSRSQRVLRECMKAGAEDVIGRPVDVELVFIKLKKILGATSAKPSRDSGIAGSLKDIVLSDLVQILCAGGKSAKVDFARNTDSGTIYVQEGEIVEAQSGDLRGEEAFYKLMTWKDGTFAAGPCDRYPERSIQLSVMSLLMEAARRNDESATI